MTENKNVEILKTVYEQWNTHKEQAFEHWMDLMAEDVQFSSLADGIEGMEFSRRCDCKKDVYRYFEEIAADWQMVYFKMDEYIAQGDRVVAIGNCKWRHNRTGKEVESPKVDIFTMKNSKIVSFMEYFDTARAVACTKA